MGVGGCGDNLYLNIILNLTNNEFNLIRAMVQMMVKW